MAKIYKLLFLFLFCISLAYSKNLFVLDTKKIENGISLRLSESISKKELKISELKDKDSYRKIIDFEATLEGIRTNYDFGDVKISIAQFNPKITRLVLNTAKEIESKISLDTKSLSFTFEKSSIKKTSTKKNRV